jgi:SAM-dependent methyltransferase
MSSTYQYSGRDLEAMSFAVNYHRWILKMFMPYLGRNIVEVGAGTGGFSEMLLETGPESLVLLEPSEKMFAILEQALPATKTIHGTFRQCLNDICTPKRPDSIVYVNVLEHIEDDAMELKAIHDALIPGGRVCIFVPALQTLMGSIDRELGHFRRYSRSELENKCTAAGFRVRLLMYFDAFGVAPWWFMNRVVKSKNLSEHGVRFYDKYVVPVGQWAEGLISPPIGKNLIFVGEKAS